MTPIRPIAKRLEPGSAQIQTDIGNRWLQSDFQGSAQEIARRLLGARLVRQLGSQRLSGIIVEVEAYLATGDAASHSAKGPRKRNAAMFQSAGSLYVYIIHTRHCLNVVTEEVGIGSAVLIRAIEPVEGIDTMARLRQQPDPARKLWAGSEIRRLTSGPGRICDALQVDLKLNGQCMISSGQIWIESPAPLVQAQLQSADYGNSPRIGITRAADLPLRWFLEGHQLVSGRASDHARGRYWRFGQ